jgi:hypothetical protein
MLPEHRSKYKTIRICDSLTGCTFGKKNKGPIPALHGSTSYVPSYMKHHLSLQVAGLLSTPLANQPAAEEMPTPSVITAHLHNIEVSPITLV